MLQRIFKSDYAKVYFFDIIAKIFAAVISIIIIRVLSVKDYSEYTYFFSISSFLSGILGSGLGLAYTTYAVEMRERDINSDIYLYRELERKLFIIYPIISCICLWGIKSFFGGTYITIIFGIIYGMLLSFNQINIVFFQARKSYVTAGIISNIKSLLLSIVLSILLVVGNHDAIVWIYFFYIISVMVSIVVTSYYIKRIVENEQHCEKFQKSYLRYMLKDSVWTILYMFIISAFNQMDVMMLTGLSNERAVASYGVAYKYYALVISLLPAIQVVLRVNCSGKQMSDAVERRKRVISWVKKSSPIALIVLFIGIIGASIFFPYINGKKYNDAISAFNILMVGAALSYITAPNVSIMVGAKKQKILCVFSLCSFIVNIVGNYFFIPIGGIVAASIATVVSHLILNGGSTLYLIIKGKQSV